MVFPDGAVVKNLLGNVRDARDMGLIPGLGRSLGIGNGNPLQYSFMENSMDRDLNHCHFCRSDPGVQEMSHMFMQNKLNLELFPPTRICGKSNISH